MLADFFVLKYAEEFGKDVKRIATSAIDLLMAYHWPGNGAEREDFLVTHRELPWNITEE